MQQVRQLVQQAQIDAQRAHQRASVPMRSALDKLFAVLDVWEARRLRPALLAWKRAAAALPAQPRHSGYGYGYAPSYGRASGGGGMDVGAVQHLNSLTTATGSTCAPGGLFAAYTMTPQRQPPAPQQQQQPRSALASTQAPTTARRGSDLGGRGGRYPYQW